MHVRGRIETSAGCRIEDVRKLVTTFSSATLGALNLTQTRIFLSVRVRLATHCHAGILALVKFGF